MGRKYVTREGKYGAYTKDFPCNACGGTGINQRLYSTNCARCSAEIVYPRDATYPPKYCRSCKDLMAAEWRTTYCKVCGVEIKYNVHWSNIPDTCKPCIEREKAKWKTTYCKVCSAVIKYHTDWSRIPDTCKPCIEKEKAKWKTKFCKNCGAEIKYHVEWNKIPDLCKNCVEKEKAKWKTARCVDCGTEIRYYVDWTNIPTRCKSCADKVKQALARVALNATWCERIARSKALEKANAEPWKEARKWVENDCTTKVRAGWSRDFECPTTDVVVYIKGVRGHYHFVVDENGTELISEWRYK